MSDIKNENIEKSIPLNQIAITADINGTSNTFLLQRDHTKTIPKTKLNLGSGINGAGALTIMDFDQREWKSIDIQEAYEADEHYDIGTGIREENSSMEMMGLGDFFEHLTRVKGKFVAKECYRVLKPGGKVLISVPDMTTVIPKYLENDGLDDGIAGLIWGQQDEVYGRNCLPDSHYAGYTETSLKKVFSDAGFTKMKRIKIHDVWYELGMEIYK